MVVKVADNNDGSKWSRGNTLFYRDGSGQPLFFPRATSAGDHYLADYNGFHLSYKGVERLPLKSEDPLKVGWARLPVLEFREKESEPFASPLSGRATFEVRDAAGSIVYSFRQFFESASRDWQALFLEKGFGVIVLNPNPEPVVVTLTFWSQEETSSSQRRAGPRATQSAILVGGGSVISGFAEDFWMAITAGTLDVSAPLPVVVFVLEGPREYLKPIIGLHSNP